MRCASHRANLLSLLNSKHDRPLPDALDWEEVLRIADHAGVSALLFHSIKHLKEKVAIPDETYLKLKKGYQFNELRNALVLEEFDRLIAAFEKENIPSILLKGIYFLKTAYRDRIGIRIMSDIDLLVKDEDWARAGQAIESRGYWRSDEPGERTAAMYVKRKRNEFTAAPVHLHRHIVNLTLPFFNLNWSKVGMEEIWSSRVPLESDKHGSGLIMSPEHTLLALCAHGLSHGFSRLTLLHDIHAHITYYRDTLDWEKVIDSARRWNIVIPLHIGLLTTRMAFRADIPEGLPGRLRPEGMSFYERCFMHYLSKNPYPNENMNMLLYLSLNRRARKTIKFIYMTLSLIIRKNTVGYRDDRSRRSRKSR
jgi:hypothetical protein